MLLPEAVSAPRAVWRGLLTPGCRVPPREPWFCHSKSVGTEVAELREACPVSLSVLMAEPRWNETWSLFLGCRRGGRRAAPSPIRAGGRTGPWQAPRSICPREAEPSTPPALVAWLGLDRKVPWSEETECPLGPAKGSLPEWRGNVRLGARLDSGWRS